jgi:hypothetical protein
LIIPKNLIELIKNNTIKNVSLGYDRFCLFDVDNIKNGQIGYSVDREGNSLTTEQRGSWQANWLVIGFQENCGDPFFIDIASDEFPVYTSINGGEWDLTMVADSYTNFIEILTNLKKLSKDRENPVKLETKPISIEEEQRFIDGVEAKNIKTEIWYWENLFE